MKVFFTRIVLSVAACCMIMSNGAYAATIYSNDFEGTGGTVPSEWTSEDSPGSVLTIVNDDGTPAANINTGDTLSIAASSKEGTFGAITNTSFVNVGDVIELSFDIRMTTLPNNANGIRFGIHDSSGKGFRVGMGTGTSSGGIALVAENGTSPDILFGGAGTRDVLRSGSVGTGAGGIPDSAPYNFQLRLTRTFDGTDGVLVELLRDGVPAVDPPSVTQTASAVVPLLTSFDNITFSTGATNVALIDNISVTYTEVPEPASALLMCVGVMIAGASVRRRR